MPTHDQLVITNTSHVNQSLPRYESDRTGDDTRREDLGASVLRFVIASMDQIIGRL